jgi:aryl-alcohol dehydrogenase-like predicted oxidoreductase
MKPTYIKDEKSAHSFSHGGRLVCGTSGLGGVWGEIDPEESVQSILFALENGIRAFDTAPSYANAETYLGLALRKWKGEKPFISTKVGRLKGVDAFDCKTDYSSSRMKQSVHESLEKLGLEKVDLLFLHEPQLVPINEIDSILKTLHDLKAEGLCDLIGVGGNPTDEFRPFITKENFDVISGFLKMDACNLSAFDKDVPRMKKEGIRYYAASALHFSLLGNRYNKYLADGPDGEYITQKDLDHAKKIKALADEQKMEISSLSQRYLFSIAEADRVVVGARNMQQIKSTLNDWNSGKLSEELFNIITDINTRN